ncbi:hypothetical protein K8I28_16435 [bacterium]|nr:hypothetical protein [bacterium]
MNKEDPGMEFTTRFVPFGTIAPNPLPEREIWLDVGNRCGSGVLDHHGGDTTAWSASEIVLNNYDSLLLPVVKNAHRIEFVVHQWPDMDAICSRWLAEKIIRLRFCEREAKALKSLVQIISENDQGYLKVGTLEDNWLIVCQTSLDTDFRVVDDKSRLEAGIELLDQTLDLLLKSIPLQEIAHNLMSPEVYTRLLTAQRDYQEDLQRSVQFQIRLPVQQLKRYQRDIHQNPQSSPSQEDFRWTLTDALHLSDPTSSLFKELARGDKKNSQLGNGFGLLIVSRHEEETFKHTKRTRHTISTDPLSGLYLAGLGTELEQLEEMKENSLKLPLAEGRERVEPGTGRHGYDVPSPWYDGRGHEHTIVDSPAVTIENKQICGSLLDDEEIFEAIWEYGNPSRFIRFQNAVLTLILPALSKGEMDSSWSKGRLIHEYYPDLSEEVLNTFSNPNSKVQLSIRELIVFPDDLPSEITHAEVQYWQLAPGTELFVCTYYFDESLNYFNTIADQVHYYRWSKLSPNLHPRLMLAPLSEGYHLLNCTIHPQDLSLSTSSFAFLQAIHQAVNGEDGKFEHLATKEEIASLHKIVAHDSQSAILLNQVGTLQVRKASSKLPENRTSYPRNNLTGITALSFLHKVSIDKLEANFASHRSESNSTKASKAVIADRWQMFFIKQYFHFSRISDSKVKQSYYENLEDVLELSDRMDKTRTKIEELSQQIRDTRADFYEKIAFWISLVFLPLGLTASFFSGTHMEKGYSREHLLFTNSFGMLDGWIQFMIVFLSISLISIILWFILRYVYRKQNIIELTTKSINLSQRRKDSSI